MIFFYYNNFEITGGPCNLLGSNWCDLFTNRTIFCLKSYLFPSQWGGYTKKTKQPIRFQGLFKVTNQIVGKWKREYHEANFATFVSKKKWMNLFSNQLYTTSIKYLNWPNSVLGRFQNGCNKVVIVTCNLKLNSRCALVRFWNHAYDFSPNYTHFEITGGPCDLIGSNWCDLFTNRTIFCFKSHLFPSQWAGHTKNKTTNQISRLV